MGDIQPITSNQKPTVLLVTSAVREIDPVQWARVNERFDIIIYDGTSVAEFISRLQPGGAYSHINAIVRTGWLKAEPFASQFLFTATVAPHFPSSLKIIICSGHGYDSVDIPKLTKLGIWYCNAPDTCTEAVANTALYLILNVFRYFTFAERAARINWGMAMELGMKAEEPTGKILGIVGMGDIGVAFAGKAALGLGMKIHYFNRSRNEKVEAKIMGGGGAVYHSTLESLLRVSDCVALACPYGPETHHMLSTKEFAMAKEGGFRIVNIARGRLIDEAALLEAMKTGKVIGVGLDVHANEPGINEQLKDDYMATVLPHIGVCSRSSWTNFDKSNLDNLEEFFFGGEGKPLTPVNIIE